MLHAGWNLAARRAFGDFGAVWWGLALAGTAALAGAAALGQFPGRPSVPFFLASGVFNAVYFAALSSAYSGGELALVYPVARGTGVALAALGAVVFLGERFAPTGALGILCVCLGVAALALGAGRFGRSTAAALVCGAATAGYSVSDKLGSTRSHALPYLGAQYVVAAVLLAPWLRARGKPLHDSLLRHPRAVAWVGFGSMAAYLLVLLAYRRAPLGYVAASREISLVFGALGGWLMLREPVPPRRAASLAMVLAGIVLIHLS
jgi:drug/metabolite transporter (DMT)-like permease